MARIAALALALTVAFVLAAAASAQAATYYVIKNGSGSACTQVAPCATITAAIAAHRVAPTPTDVIDIGAGEFTENFQADDAADNGLTIQGTIDGGGGRATTVHGKEGGISPDSCLSPPCAVVLGESGVTAVALQDINVDTQGADDDVLPVSVEGGTDLTNVHVEAHTGATVFEIVFLCADPGVKIKDSTIDATGTNAAAVTTIAGPTIVGSHLIPGQFSAGVQQVASVGEPMVLRRTWVDAGGSGPAIGVVSTGDLTLDSSLITGGFIGAVFQGNGSSTWEVHNTTVDVGAPGEYDSALPDISVNPASGETIDVGINSSLLAEEIQAPSPDGGGSITCTNTDFQLVLVDPPVTADCTAGSNGNTTTDPADQFVGGSPFDWSLKADAPAVDTGDPAAPLPGFSETDLAGNPRKVAGLATTCPGAIVDKGAYEAAAVTCVPVLRHTPAIKHADAPVVGGRVTANAGKWFNNPTSFHYQWMRCSGPATSDCTEIGGATRAAYRGVSPDDVGMTLRARVIATNTSGDSEPAFTAQSGVVTLESPTSLHAPAIKNAAAPVVGDRITGSTGQWTGEPVTRAYQWVRCPTSATDPADCTLIPRATHGAYRVSADDVNSVLRFRVIASNPAGVSPPAFSGPSGIVTSAV